MTQELIEYIDKHLQYLRTALNGLISESPKANNEIENIRRAGRASRVFTDTYAFFESSLERDFPNLSVDDDLEAKYYYQQGKLEASEKFHDYYYGKP
jgi:hypothetical protein